MTIEQWRERLNNGFRFDSDDIDELLADWDREVVDALENEPIEVIVFDTCRRCGEVKSVNEDGYCSVGCELGFRPGEWWR